jgi:hypothetical protein
MTKVKKRINTLFAELRVGRSNWEEFLFQLWELAESSGVKIIVEMNGHRFDFTFHEAEIPEVSVIERR